MKIFLVVIMIALLASQTWAGDNAYDDTLSGKECIDIRQQINCTYKVGKDLEFSIDGIGMPDTAITVPRSKGLQGDYYATSGVRTT